MKFLEEQQTKILGIIADDPSKFAYLANQLTGEAREIAEALINAKSWGSSAKTADEARAWANQSKDRSAA
jgi:hypothetical protein